MVLLGRGLNEGAHSNGRWPGTGVKALFSLGVGMVRPRFGCGGPSNRGGRPSKTERATEAVCANKGGLLRFSGLPSLLWSGLGPAFVCARGDFQEHWMGNTYFEIYDHAYPY